MTSEAPGSESKGIQTAFLAVSLLLTVGLQLNISLQNPVPDYDEAVYFDVIRNVAVQKIPVRTSSGTLYAIHPPGYFYPAGLLYGLGLGTLTLQRSIQTALSIGLLVLVYGLSLRVWGRIAARWAVFLLAINPFFLHYAHSVYLELPETFWTILSLALWLWAERAGEPRWERYALAGVALGLGAITKYFAISLGAAYLLYYGLREGGRLWRSRPLAWIVVGSLAVFLLWPTYAWMILGVEGLRGAILGRLTGFASASGADPRTQMTGIDLLVRLAKAVGPLVALPVLAAAGAETVWTAKRRAWRGHSASERFRALLTLWFWLLGLGLLGLPTRDYKYFYPLLPVGILFLASWAEKVWAAFQPEGNARRLAISVAIIGVWVLLVFPVDLVGIDRVPWVCKLYFTDQDYTWRASAHRIEMPQMSKWIEEIAYPNERVLVGKAGPIVCYYTGLPYRLAYLSASLDAARRLLDEHRIFLADGPMERLFPRLSARERAVLALQLEEEWAEVARLGETRLWLKAY